MKKFIKLFYVAICIVMFSKVGNAQTDNHHEHTGLNGEHIDKFYLPYNYDADSLVGFDEAAAWQHAQSNTNELWKQQRMVAVLKRNYIDFHYNLKTTAGTVPTVQAPCTNPGFEDGTLNGWTAVQSTNNNSQTMLPWTSAATTQAVIVPAGTFDANLGGTVLPCVPPGGGNFAVRLGQTGTGGVSYRLNQTFTVTAANSVFVYKYAVVLQDGGHACTDQPFFNIRFETCNNVVIPCAQYQVAQMGSACSSGDPNFLTSGSSGAGWSYLPWQTRSFDLTNYIGQCVNIEFTVGGCVASQGAHPGYCYIDAACDPMTLELNGTDIPVGQTTTNMCTATTNTLCAPPGFVSYSWTGPGVTGNNNRCITTSTSGTYSVTLGMQGTSCQNPVLYSTFNVVPKPLANFTFTTNPCTTGLNVPFTDGTSINGGPAITNWYWDFNNDGIVDNTTQSPSNTYTAAGTYSTQLLVSNGGCTDSITKVLTVSSAVTANFTNTSGCLNGATNFSATPTPSTNIASHVWNFGDGSPNGSGANPIHTYTTSGVKTVSYTVTNTSGCQSTITHTLDVFPNPVLAISSNTVCLGLPTTFVNTSSVTAPASITNWSWDFENNGVVDNTTQSPTNTYTASGNYTAVLTATTNNGCVNSSSLTVKVNALPTASFTPAGACINANVALNNTSSIAAPDNISSYSWNFGAGATPATGNTANPTPLVYNTSGVKTIVLNITANTTCTASITQTVNIAPLPVANFSATSVCQGTATAFTDLSTPTGSITSWSWDFTNNASVDNSTNSPTNTYSTSGTYSVSLLVAAGSCTNAVVIPVNVWGHSIPNFIPSNVCFGATSSFNNTTDFTTNANVGGTPTWDWNFGDGSTNSTTQSPTHTYTSSTTSAYSVTLTATTSNGCVDNVVKTVTVNTLPTATFTPVNACVNSNVLLNNASNIALPDNITTYAWNFGTGSVPSSTSSVQNPSTLSYNSSGIKSITLIVTANTTCSASITQTVEVYPQPVANFSATAVCQSTATAYTDLSTPTGSITAWAWDYTNNGSVDNATNSPSNIFTSSGTFTTSLIVTDSHTCKDTVKLPVDVWGHTIPDFSPNNVCFGTSSLFTNLTDETTNANVGSGTTYVWDFADASGTSALLSPSHTYTLGGNVNAIYNVSLTATSTHSCVDNVVKPVHVFAIPTASFTSDSVCLGSPSHLVDASNGNGNTVNTYAWDFSSNGTTDITGVANPNYVFPTIGNNSVTYTVSTTPTVGLVCSNVTSSITVWVNPIPVPDFTFVNNCVNAQPNTFNGSSSAIAVGTNTAYVWAYGDGAVSNPTNTATSTHTYVTAGLYNATLTITSNKGCVANVVKQVEVYAKPSAFPANSKVCDGVAMTFTAQTLAGSGTITGWYWDFNNSITSFEANGQTPGFTFAGAGQQTVALVTETNHGCRDTVHKIIYVNYVPVADFKVDDPDGCPTHCVQFTDLSTPVTGPAQINQWQWTLGDGTVVTNSTNAPVNNCYNNSSSSDLALFDVKLVITTDSGCVSVPNNKIGFITVYPTPIAGYFVDPNPGNVLTPLEYFTNTSVGYTKWWWSFGDGPFKTDSVNVNPTHFYSDATAGIYNSNLIVMNQYGCRDTAYVAVEIKPEFTFYIPNAFSPTNNDGINDTFNGVGIGIDKYEMWIFDRWGAMIFYTDDINKGWDGRVQGKPSEGKQDVYTWKVKLRDVLGKKHDYIGHVTLLK